MIFFKLIYLFRIRYIFLFYVFFAYSLQINEEKFYLYKFFKFKNKLIFQKKDFVIIGEHAATISNLELGQISIKSLFLLIQLFTVENASSIGLKSGEYGGRNNTLQPTLFITLIISSL